MLRGYCVPSAHLGSDVTIPSHGAGSLQYSQKTVFWDLPGLVLPVLCLPTRATVAPISPLSYKDRDVDDQVITMRMGKAAVTRPFLSCGAPYGLDPPPAVLLPWLSTVDVEDIHCLF